PEQWTGYRLAEMRRRTAPESPSGSTEHLVDLGTLAAALYTLQLLSQLALDRLAQADHFTVGLGQGGQHVGQQRLIPIRLGHGLLHQLTTELVQLAHLLPIACLHGSDQCLMGALQLFDGNSHDDLPGLVQDWRMPSQPSLISRSNLATSSSMAGSFFRLAWLSRCCMKAYRLSRFAAISPPFSVST